MNHVNEDVVRSILKLLERSDYLSNSKGESTVGCSYDFDDEDNEDCLHERIAELELEVSELQDEIAERDFYMVLQENEELLKEIKVLREDNLQQRLAFNRHINEVILMLDDEKYII